MAGSSNTTWSKGFSGNPDGVARGSAAFAELVAAIGGEWVTYPVDARTRRLVDGMAASAGFAPRYAVTVNRVGTLLNMIRNGVGIGVVPSSERPLQSDRDITSRPLAGARISRLGIIRLRERELTQAASALLAVMKFWVRAVAPRRLRAARRS